MNPHVPFLAPTFPPVTEVARQYAEIVASGVYSNSGPKERQFATMLAAEVGPECRASLTSNATVAIQLACSALFRPDRRFVLVPSFTFAAGPLALQWCGFEVVFFDVEAETWQPSLEVAKRFLADHPEETAGILLTQTFGVGVDAIGDWETLSLAHDVPLVIDSAAGYGAVYPDGTPLGGRGNCEVFSLHATKMLAVGEGGVITSTDADLIGRLDRLKNFGFDASRSSVALGSNAKLDELTAAIGLLQLRSLGDRIHQRREILRQYRELMTPIGLEFQVGAERSAPAFVPAILPEAATRDDLIAGLGAAGVECRSYYNPPVHRQPHFAGARCASELAVTEQLASRMISFPMSDDLAPETIARIARTTTHVLEGC